MMERALNPSTIDGVQMTNRYMKRYMTSLIIREMWTPITMRYYFTTVRMDIIFLSSADVDVEKLEPLCTVGGNVK